MNKRIYIAIVLLGVSMLGVISFQGYWLKQNHNNELLTFRHDVYRSLSMAMNLELDKRIELLVGTADVESFKQKHNNEKFRRHRSNRMGKGTSKRFMKDEFTDVIYCDTIGVNNQNKRGDFNFKQKQFDRVVLSLMSKIEDPKYVHGANFNTEVFNTAFRNELAEFGIDIDYKLALLAYNNKIIKEINGQFNKSDLSISTFFKLRHSAIPGAKVAILFPHKNRYLASKNRFMVLTSIFLILLSIGSIIYIIRSFFSQKRISEIRRDFMNNMTHELKTPISTVGLALEAMQNFKILENPERTQQYIGIARKENHRLGMLVEKVLKMSAYEQENIHMKWENIQGDISVEEVISNLTFQIENKGGNIIKNMNASMAIVRVDKVHFTNVIYNLLDNALKYSGDKPEINISTYVKDDFWFVEVTDNGVGIPTTYQNKIFEKFFRVPSGNVHNVKGYGLGLSYVFNITNRFKGDVSVRSEVEKGSTFIIKLPISNG